MFNNKKKMKKRIWELESLVATFQEKITYLTNRLHTAEKKKGWRVVKHQKHEIWIKDDSLTFVGSIYYITDEMKDTNALSSTGYSFDIVIDGQRIVIVDEDEEIVKTVRMMILNREGTTDLDKEISGIRPNGSEK